MMSAVSPEAVRLREVEADFDWFGRVFSHYCPTPTDPKEAESRG